MKGLTKGFTLAEVLITLAIIGVVAALTIPSVISNSQQQEFKTGLRKAVSVLNSAITMNMAIDGETPYDNANLMGYLMRHMSIIESTTNLSEKFQILSPNGDSWQNSAFYTTDGMRYEFRSGGFQFYNLRLHESNTIVPCTMSMDGSKIPSLSCEGCGSYGLNSNTNQTTKPPCVIAVDVNGDRKPNPSNVNCKSVECAKKYKYSDPLGLKLSDTFTVMITDKEAVPFGIAAQRAENVTFLSTYKPSI